MISDQQRIHRYNHSHWSFFIYRIIHFVRLFPDRHPQDLLSNDSMSQDKEGINVNETGINVMVTGSLC